MTDLPAPLDAHASARRLAHEVVVERRLFELTGAAAAEADDDEVVLVLGAESGHHAWRADQLAALVPLLATKAPDAWLVEATDSAAVLFDRLDAEVAREVDEGIDTGLAVLGVVHRLIVPELRRAWAERLIRCAPATDAALARVLRLVEFDAGLDADRALPVLTRLNAATGGRSGPSRR